MSVFFSIIVVSFNAEKSIEKTILSILNQTYEDYEVIVKDAGSVDLTLSKIPESSKIHVYSEKDKGIYDGMNEAIKKANGKYLCFLNCGDCFAHKDVLRDIYSGVAKTTGVGVVYGDYIKDEIKSNQIRNISKFNFYRNTLCHQSVFFHKELFELYGTYDTSLQIAADYEFMLRVWNKGVPYYFVDTAVCVYESGGVSESKRGLKQKKKDRKVICKRYFSKKERFMYKAFFIVTFLPVRNWLNSSKSPRFLRKMYRAIVNKTKK